MVKKFSGLAFLLIVFLNTMSFSQIQDSAVTIKVYQHKNGWAYDIYLNSKLFIHQPFVPVVQGNIPFKTKDDAEKTAKKVKEKIINNVSPPAITREELEEMKIEY